MPVIGGGLVGVVLFALWVFCIFDVIRSEETLVRNLPKIVWLLLVIFTWVVGAVAWLVLGRPQGVTRAPGGASGAGRKGPVGPEDSPKFMSALEEKRRLEKWEEELRRREERLRRSEEEGGSDKQG